MWGRPMSRKVLMGLVFALTAGTAQAAPVNDGLVLESVVLVMRHGVRPPTKAVAMPAGTAAQDWPEWPVPPGWLTPHGAHAVERLGEADGAWLRARNILPTKGCPQAGAIRVVADSDQRTIATAEHWLKALVPGCHVASDHVAQGSDDPRFNALVAGLGTLDPPRAEAAVAQAIGPQGLAGLDAAYRALLNRLDSVLCGQVKQGCGVSGTPTALAAAKGEGRPKLTGALDRASTAAQILLLEYGDGKPLAQVGWGRATAQDIADFSAFHALEFTLLARPKAIASPNLAGLKPIIREGLTKSAKLTLISGHDTNVANLAGLLDLHWQVPGFAADDPAPGGAIVLERLRARDGQRFIRASYRAQTLDQIRSAEPLTKAYQGTIAFAACAPQPVLGLCRLDDVLKMLDQ
jgi:4-phytase/acid phosphatase